MSFFEIVSAICSVLAFFALIGNVLQYTKKREQAKDLFQMVQTQYNNYYLIARAITRLNSKTCELKDDINFASEINFIRGVADSARIQLMNFSQNQLGKSVSYQHPAYPEKKEFSDAVKMGLPPEKDGIADKISISKSILKSIGYIVNENWNNSEEKKGIKSILLLNEENGGIPGSNIGMAEYSNTDYIQPGKHEDQEFFYVLSGEGKAKIDNMEIDIREGIMFVVPPETNHSILTNNASEPVKVLWMHN